MEIVVEPTVVTVGKARLQLERPVSMVACYEVAAAAAGDTPHRALGAALGLCSAHVRNWVGPYRGDVLEYGGRVLDYFLAREVPFEAIVEAGRAAWRLCADLVPTEPEVAAAADFSVAPAAVSTS